TLAVRPSLLARTNVGKGVQFSVVLGSGRRAWRGRSATMTVIVAEVDGDGCGGAAVATCIPRDGRQRVGAIPGRGGVPGDLILGGGGLRPERRAIQVELKPGHSHV